MRCSVCRTWPTCTTCTSGRSEAASPRSRRTCSSTRARTVMRSGSSGIGAAIARALADAGAKVAGGARRVDVLQTEVKLELDVTDPASSDRFVTAALEELGGLDILVNNAGLGLGRDPFDKSSEED